MLASWVFVVLSAVGVVVSDFVGTVDVGAEEEEDDGEEGDGSAVVGAAAEAKKLFLTMYRMHCRISLCSLLMSSSSSFSSNCCCLLGPCGTGGARGLRG